MSQTPFSSSRKESPSTDAMYDLEMKVQVVDGRVEDVNKAIDNMSRTQNLKTDRQDAEIEGLKDSFKQLCEEVRSNHRNMGNLVRNISESNKKELQATQDAYESRVYGETKMATQIAKASRKIHTLSVGAAHLGRTQRKMIQSRKEDKATLDQLTENMRMVEELSVNQKDLYRLVQQRPQFAPSAPTTSARPSLMDEIGPSLLPGTGEGTPYPSQWSAIHREVMGSGYSSRYETPSRRFDGRMSSFSPLDQGYPQQQKLETQLLVGIAQRRVREDGGGSSAAALKPIHRPMPAGVDEIDEDGIFGTDPNLQSMTGIVVPTAMHAGEPGDSKFMLRSRPLLDDPAYESDEGTHGSPTAQKGLHIALQRTRQEEATVSILSADSEGEKPLVGFQGERDQGQVSAVDQSGCCTPMGKDSNNAAIEIHRTEPMTTSPPIILSPARVPEDEHFTKGEEMSEKPVIGWSFPQSLLHPGQVIDEHLRNLRRRALPEKGYPNLKDWVVGAADSKDNTNVVAQASGDWIKWKSLQLVSSNSFNRLVTRVSRAMVYAVLFCCFLALLVLVIRLRKTFTKEDAGIVYWSPGDGYFVHPLHSL
ncbi:hypothetical protein NLJ89_g8204 [Agrocybe chaxingu]|uniref:Uncharacterized protein n=1 Tax=Agrocybe chaxingu TaxID=84603 RepID=A0A9W8JVC2_9AGAR|nr:hypothetical protein NLJ89_g8204 [Agrocybe chaxingu]